MKKGSSYPYLEKVEGNKWAVILPKQKDWQVTGEGEIPVFLSHTKEEAWRKFIENYIEHREDYKKLFKSMNSYEKINEIDEKAIEYLEERASTTIDSMFDVLQVPEEERKEKKKEAIEKLLKDGYWSISNESGIGALTWQKWRRKENTFLDIVGAVAVDGNAPSLKNFVWFLDEAPYYKDDFPEEKVNAIINSVISDFKEACKRAGVDFGVETWSEFAEELSNFRETEGIEWTNRRIGEVVEYDYNGEDVSFGIHVIEDPSGYVFISDCIGNMYVVLVPEESGNIENNTYIALDGKIFTSKEEAEDYFRNAVREGRITFEDFYNDYLRRGYDEEDAEVQARMMIKNYIEQPHKIVTHAPPRHLDDTLAVALLSQKYPQAEIEFVHPQDEKLEKYRKDPTVILVDVGGDYNPELKNYDHHQNPYLPCSFVQVLNHEFQKYMELFQEDNRLERALEFIDVKDRKGFKAALEETGESPSNLAFFLESMLLKTDESGIRLIGKTLTRYLEEILEQAEKMKRVSVIHDNETGITVVYDVFGLKPGELFKRYDADLVIQRNVQNKNHTTIIKNTQNGLLADADLSKLFDDYEKVFIHNTGFMAVINENIENISLDDILKIVSQLSNDNENDHGLGR